MMARCGSIPYTMSMPGFNHYAKLARILSQEPDGWYIVRIDEPTSATKFSGEVVHFDHYYRLYSRNGEKIRTVSFSKSNGSQVPSTVTLSNFPLLR